MTAGTRTLQKPPKPILVSIGRNHVRIYPRSGERGRAPRWQIADYSSGKRRLRSFASERAARDEAARMVARLNAVDHAGAGMTGDDRRDLARATDFVAPLGLDVPTACCLLAEAAALVGHENIVAACKAYARRAPVARTPLPLGKAVVDLLEAKETKGRSNRHLDDLRYRLGRFASDHPGMALGDFTTASVQSWLDRLTGKAGKPLSAQSRRNFTTVVGGLFEFHRCRGAIPDNPVADVERETIRRVEDVAYWKPDEVKALLEHIAPEAKAGLVLALFSGLRSSEVCQLLWSNVDLNQKHVAIRADIAKTASRRLVPIPDNARAWLRSLVGPQDARVFEGQPDRFSRLVSAACKTAQINRVKNGARHSAITYRVALTGDVARVALDCGNVAEIIHKHYRGLATEAEARAFFEIKPRPISPKEGAANAS